MRWVRLHVEFVRSSLQRANSSSMEVFNYQENTRIMAHEEPDPTTGGENAARKQSGGRAIKFARRRAAAKKAAETRRGISGLVKKNGLKRPQASLEHGN